MEQQGILTNYNANFNESFNAGKIYNAALYLRFSKDDGQTIDSSSIETQQMMLERYCSDKGYRIFDVYKDDGYTGLNFDRPDFQRMLNDIDDKKVNMVVTKDLSRLGRDYIQTGYYSEIYFNQRDVRYIAINDGFDSLKQDNDIAPFRNILNNMYSKDLSRKIKSALRQRLNNGLHCFPYAPYGYKKHPDNRNKLIIDEETAGAVREIYRLALEGNGCTFIAKTLTARQVLVPAAYKARNGAAKFVRHLPTGKEIHPYRWSANTVNHILRDGVYTGDTIGGRCEVADARTGKTRQVPKERHVVVLNTHEPIVSRDNFERVRQLVAARHKPAWRHEENIFRGILFCGQCGHRMHLAVHNIKSKNKTVVKTVSYRCPNRANNPHECTQHNSIAYKDLKERVWESVKKTINLLQSGGSTLDALKKRLAGQGNSEKQLAEKKKIEKRLNAITALVRRLYEDFIAERLDEEGYRELLAGYQTEKKTLTERLTVITAELGNANDFEERLNQLRLLAALYTDCAELTAEIVHKLIERVEVTPMRNADGKKIKAINIVYRFINNTL